MGFFEAVRAQFVNCFDYSGRASRSEFWYPVLFGFLASIACALVDASTGHQVLGSLLSLALFLPSISLQARRLHDTGRTGWWIAANPALVILVLALFLAGGSTLGTVCLALGGLVGAGVNIAMLIWYCDAGSPGPNEYGQNPLERPYPADPRFA